MGSEHAPPLFLEIAAAFSRNNILKKYFFNVNFPISIPKQKKIKNKVSRINTPIKNYFPTNAGVNKWSNR